MTGLVDRGSACPKRRSRAEWCGVLMGRRHDTKESYRSAGSATIVGWVKGSTEWNGVAWFRKLWARAGLVEQRPQDSCGSKHFTRSLVINSVLRVKIDPLCVIVIIWDEI